MLADQVVSVTDLRTKTKQSLGGLEYGPKFVFVNNSPVAVLISLEEYEMLTSPDLSELTHEEVTSKMRTKADEALATPKEELLDI